MTEQHNEPGMPVTADESALDAQADTTRRPTRGGMAALKAVVVLVGLAGALVAGVMMLFGP